MVSVTTVSAELIQVRLGLGGSGEHFGYTHRLSVARHQARLPDGALVRICHRQYLVQGQLTVLQETFP